MISRSINLPFKKNSVFLFGPRQVGKSMLVRHLLFAEEHIEIDLLKNDILLKYKAKPLCVSTCETPYMAGVIPVIPWKHFFRKDEGSD